MSNGIHRIGQKIVCIEDFSNWVGKPSCIKVIPVLNAVYTVREFVELHHPTGIGLLLCELHNPPCTCFGEGEITFEIQYFRPVIEDESKTDIGFAQKILRKQTTRKSRKINEDA